MLQKFIDGQFWKFGENDAVLIFNSINSILTAVDLFIMSFGKVVVFNYLDYCVVLK
jgi:hypothetical protein